MLTNKWIWLGVSLALLFSLLSYELFFVKQGNAQLSKELTRQGAAAHANKNAEYELFNDKSVTGSDVLQAVSRYALKNSFGIYLNISGSTGCYATNGKTCFSADYSTGLANASTISSISKSDLTVTSSRYFIDPTKQYSAKLVLKTGVVVGVLIKG